jgi:hypothetical protein
MTFSRSSDRMRGLCCPDHCACSRCREITTTAVPSPGRKTTGGERGWWMLCPVRNRIQGVGASCRGTPIPSQVRILGRSLVRYEFERRN